MDAKQVNALLAILYPARVIEKAIKIVRYESRARVCVATTINIAKNIGIY